MDFTEDNDVRAPDATRRERIIDNEFDLDSRIAQLMSNGLEAEEARHIAMSQMVDVEDKRVASARDEKVNFLKSQNYADEIRRKQNMSELNVEKRLKFADKIEEIKQILFKLQRMRLNYQGTLDSAIEHYEETGGNPLEISDDLSREIEKDLKTMVARNRLTQTESDKIQELITTPTYDVGFSDDEDESGVSYYAGSRRRRKNRKSRKSRKSRRNTKKTRRNRRRSRSRR